MRPGGQHGEQERSLRTTSPSPRVSTTNQVTPSLLKFTNRKKEILNKYILYPRSGQGF